MTDQNKDKFYCYPDEIWVLKTAHCPRVRCGGVFPCKAKLNLDEAVRGNKYFKLMLVICRFCKHFIDQRREVSGFERYLCAKKENTVYEAYFCKKTDFLRGKLEQSI